MSIDRQTYKHKCKLITEWKRFCTEEFEIAENRSFTRIIEREYPYYTLAISHKHAVKPLFSEDKIDFQSKKIRDISAVIFETIGYDISKSSTNAYVDDCGGETGDNTQIVMSMFKREDYDLSQTILHEQVHIHLINNNHSSDIEEPIADYFAYQAASMYYKNQPETLNRLKENKRTEDQYGSWYNRYSKKLNNAYNMSKEKGRAILSEAEKSYADQFIIGDIKINNAFFLDDRIYYQNAKAVQDILKNKNPRDYLKKLASTKEISTIKELYHAVNS